MTFRIWQVKPGYIAQYGFRSADEVCGPYLERGIPREVYACVYAGHAAEEPVMRQTIYPMTNVEQLREAVERAAARPSPAEEIFAAAAEPEDAPPP